MYGTNPDAYLVETTLHLLGIFVIGKRDGGIRDEKHPVNTAEKVGDVAYRILEVLFARIGRVADKKKSHDKVVLYS